MSRIDEQAVLHKTAPDSQPGLDTKVTCRPKPDRRRLSDTLDHWAAAIKNLKAYTTRHSLNRNAS